MEERNIFSNFHRVAFVLPCASFPYALLLFLYVLFYKSEILDEYFMGTALIPLGILIAYPALAFVLSVCFTAAALINGWDSRFCTKIVLIIKLVQIPAYILIFILGVLFFITIFTFGFSLAFVVLDVAVIIMTGMLGTAAAVRAYKENKCSFSMMILLSIAQYIFCVDVFASLYLFFKVREGEKNSEVQN